MNKLKISTGLAILAACLMVLGYVGAPQAMNSANYQLAPSGANSGGFTNRTSASSVMKYDALGDGAFAGYSSAGYTLSAGGVTAIAFAPSDMTPPSSSIDDPTEGGDVTTAPYTVTGTASDWGSGSGVSEVEVSDDGGATWGMANYTSGSWSYSWNAGSAGPHNLISRARDASGNKETPSSGVNATAKSTLSAGRSPITLYYEQGRPDPTTAAYVQASPWPVYVNASTTSPWLIPSDAPYETDARVPLHVAGFLMTPGNYTSIVKVYGWYVANEPITIPLDLTVLSAQSHESELPHSNYNDFLDGASDCNFCHDLFPGGSTFVPIGVDMKPWFCGSCHSAAGMAHDRGLASSNGHAVGYEMLGLPPFENPTGACDKSMGANLDYQERIVCVTCHNPMCKTEDVPRVWEVTTTDDNRNYYLPNGGWDNYGRLVPFVYRSPSPPISAPANIQDRKAYLVDPSEYIYNDIEGSITFNEAQDADDCVYVTLDYEYLRVGSQANFTCATCHLENTHQPMSDNTFNCLDCHTAHGTTNGLQVRESIYIPGEGAFPIMFRYTTSLAGFTFTNISGALGLCEVCHTNTLYHNRAGTGQPHYDGENCTMICHDHYNSFMY